MIYDNRIARGLFNTRFLLVKNGHYCLLILAFISMLSEMVEAGDPLRYRAGLKLSTEGNKLSVRESRSIIDSLRDKSGFQEIGFDADGFLSLGDPNNIVGGSSTARDLLLAAKNLSYAIDLESHNYSMDIAFARLDKPVHYFNFSSGDEIDVYPIQIDFTDFKKLRGDKAVIASFDIGFVILHELGHAVLGLRDTLDMAEGAGECEHYVNGIRREIGYPIRENYIARLYSRSTIPTEQTFNMAELNFTQSVDDEGRSKVLRYILSWSAREVGPIASCDVRRGQAPLSIALN